MPLVVYGTSQSRAMRTLWMLEELGIDFEHKAIDFRTDTMAPEFRAINPNGRIPTVVTEQGEVLWESMAINLTLAKRFASELAPANAHEEALATQWSFWVMAEVEKDLLESLFCALGFMGREQNADKAAKYAARLDRPFKVIDAQLSEREWLVADRFTVADLNVASLFPWAKMAGIDLAPHAALARWVDRCLARPAFERARLRS